jgi:hypothetical protein
MARTPRQVYGGTPYRDAFQPQKTEVIGLLEEFDTRIDEARSAALSGAQWKDPVRVASTANVAIATALENGDTLDGVTLATGDRVLLKNQSTASQNGIYVVAASGTAARATDADTEAELLGAAVYVRAGTVNAGKQFVCSTVAPITVGTTPLSFREISDQSALNANLATVTDEVEEARGVQPTLGDRLDAVEARAGDTSEIFDQYVEVSTDEDGQILTGQRRDGYFVADRFRIETLFDGFDVGAPTIAPRIANWRELIVDSTLRPVWGRTFDGLEYEARNGVLVLISGSVEQAQTYDFDYVTGAHAIDEPATDLMVLIIGQSLAQGGNADPADTPVTTEPEHPDFALMFDVGMIPAGRTVTGYTDLYEQIYITSKETIASGLADVVMSGLNARIGRKPRMVFAVAAKGGQAYFGGAAADDGLKRGSVQYAEALRLVERAKAISAEAGRRLIVAAACVVHGEQDVGIGTKRWQYRRALDQWRTHLDADIRQITAQTEPLRFYANQVNRGSITAGIPADVSLAQLEASETNDLIRCVGPIYSTPQAGAGDAAHPSARGFRRMGLQFGLHMLEDYFGPYLEPLRVVEAWWASTTTIRLRYSHEVAIESTDDLITVSTLGAGKGVDFVDGPNADAPSASSTVTGIALVTDQPDTIEVTLNAAPTGKRPRIFVANRFTGSGAHGPVTSPRSGIRTATSYFTDSQDDFDAYQWACVQEINLPPL